MFLLNQQTHALFHTGEAPWPLLVCVLGNFRLLRAGQAIALRRGGKAEILLCHLGMRYGQVVTSDTLLNLLWPSCDDTLAIQSLHSLIYSLRKLVGDAISSAAPILHEEGCYRLNLEAGVGVDLACFDAFTKTGDQQARTGDMAAAANAYNCAVNLYHGDLYGDADVQEAMQREHLRARYLTLQAQLADYDFAQHDYAPCMNRSWLLLSQDPCREDAHRMVMRCYVRQGERAEALRHYDVCISVLRAEFDAPPEPATIALFELIRLHPGSV